MYNKLKNHEKVIFDALLIFLVLYYAWSAVIEPAATQFHRGIYIIITYILCILLYQSKSKIMRMVDYLLIFVSIVTIGYLMYNTAIDAFGNKQLVASPVPAVKQAATMNEIELMDLDGFPKAMSVEKGIKGVVTPLHPEAEKLRKEKGVPK